MYCGHPLQLETSIKPGVHLLDQTLASLASADVWLHSHKAGSQASTVETTLHRRFKQPYVNTSICGAGSLQGCSMSSSLGGSPSTPSWERPIKPLSQMGLLCRWSRSVTTHPSLPSKSLAQVECIAPSPPPPPPHQSKATCHFRKAFTTVGPDHGFRQPTPGISDCSCEFTCSRLYVDCQTAFLETQDELYCKSKA